MSKVIIRYWDSKLPTVSGRLYSHIALKTEKNYVSFHPNLKKEIKKNLDPKKVCHGKFFSEKDDKSLGEAKEIILKLNTAEIDKFVDILFKNKKKLTWKIWGSDYDQCFNSASIIALLLKAGGIVNSLNASKFRAEYKKAPNIYRALFLLEISADISGFYHFSSISHKEMTPELIFSLHNYAASPHYMDKCPGLRDILNAGTTCLFSGVQYSKELDTSFLPQGSSYEKVDASNNSIDDGYDMVEDAIPDLETQKIISPQ